MKSLEPGTLLQMRGKHMVKKILTDMYDMAYNYITGEHREIKENDIVLVIGSSDLAIHKDSEMWNQPDKRTIEIWLNGEQTWIREYKLQLDVYKEVSKDK